MLGKSFVKVISAQLCIPSRGHDLKDPLGQSQDGDVEGAATKVIDCIQSFGP
jgi:hypothetical protein